MPSPAPAPARRASFEALTRILGTDVTLGEALAAVRRMTPDARDRALVTEIVTGTLRHLAALDYQLAARTSRPLGSLDAAVLTTLRLSAFQLLHLGRVPAAAVVNDAVALVRVGGVTSAGGLVNAVLRRLARERDALAWPPRPETADDEAGRRGLVEHLSVVHSHPAWLVERWLARHDSAAVEAWLAFDNAPAPLTLAPVGTRVSRAALARRLDAEGVRARPTATAPEGLVVLEGAALGTRAFTDGVFIVQDEASQIVAAAVGARAGERVLDACAAPGGKTVAIAAAVGEAGTVVAADVRARRVRALAATVARTGIHAAVVQTAVEGPLPFRAGAFDRVLVDAPCSGLGTIRRDPDIRWRRQPGDLGRFADAQVALVERIVPLVAPGGRLVYSTCSSEPDENADVVRRVLARHAELTIEPVVLAGGPDISAMVAPEGWLATLPHRDGLEAFFAAVLRRHV